MYTADLQMCQKQKGGFINGERNGLINGYERTSIRKC